MLNKPNNDLNLTKTINRIVIGDVGSGKTIVAFLIALSFLDGMDFEYKKSVLRESFDLNLEKTEKNSTNNSSKNTLYEVQESNLKSVKTKKSSKITSKIKDDILNTQEKNQEILLTSYLFPQVAMLAPTEVLAFQHFQKLLELKQKNQDLLNNVQCLFLSGKQLYFNTEKLTAKKFEKAFLESLKNQENKFFFVGTQALLFRDYIFPDMVLIDEQHRFGVSQRAKLVKKWADLGIQTQISPHFISFTATPIPRTLALTFYRDLKPHFLETLQDRKPIKTKILLENNLEIELIPKIKEELQKNHKIYIICPKIEDKEEQEENDLWSTTKAKKFFEKHFKDEILVVHGKLSEKKNLLNDFKENKDKNILISTTVVEVGVDVATASLIAILNSERFGLAALHQIRGRVGRNDFEENFCYLVVKKEFQFSQRLRQLVASNDGFKIAEKDLELRGSGDFLGKQQSGYQNELDKLLGLNPDLYYKIQEMVDKLDFEKLETELPRLKKYIEMNKTQVWGE